MAGARGGSFQGRHRQRGHRLAERPLPGFTATSAFPCPTNRGQEVLVTGYGFLDTANWSLARSRAASRCRFTASVHRLWQPGNDRHDGRGLAQVDQRAARLADAACRRRRTSSRCRHDGCGSEGWRTHDGLSSLGDQLSWARLIHAPGCGRSPLERKELSPAAISQSISAMAEPETQKAARSALRSGESSIGSLFRVQAKQAPRSEPESAIGWSAALPLLPPPTFRQRQLFLPRRDRA